MTHTRAFTLLESLISIALLAFVFLGAQAALLVATRAVPHDGQPSGSTISTAGQLNVILDEIAYATSVSLASPRDLTIEVADRTGDSSSETIRFFWSGVAGEPLQRTVNGSDPVAIIANVRDFAIALEKSTIPQPVTYTESNEILLSQLDPGLINSDARIQSGNWVAQYLKPALPNGAAHWRITRVQFRAKSRGGNNGETSIQVRLPSGNNPSTVVLDETPFFENTITSSYDWREVRFGDVFKITAGSGAWIVFKWIKDSDACEVQYRNALLSLDGNMGQSANSGSSWSQMLGQNVLHYIYGRYSTPDPVTPRYALTAVRCTMRVGNGATLNASTRVLNEPEVP